ncbi:sulfite exporter TauE/SafE family protein [Pseudooceanicola sp.]|uniref:sulfite exporter TauE/SafE family protein n=1 Tax=Pseudooceanicola sp. TaxID=1914328 RepID=UPI0035C74C68
MKPLHFKRDTAGAFGGGVAMIGIPLMSLAMDPLVAGAVLAPLLLVMDAFALRHWSPKTWSRADVIWLIPGTLIGTALAAWLLTGMDERGVATLMGALGVGFALYWLTGGMSDRGWAARPVFAFTAATASGATSMIAHAGGPPLAIYLLGRGLPKAQFAGTTSIVFTFGNIAKVVPWLLITPPDAGMLWLMLICTPAVPLAIWLGWRLHGRLDQRRLYAICYGILTLVSLNLLWRGLAGYL